MLLLVFLIIQCLISKTGPEKCIWEESKTLLQQGKLAIDLHFVSLWLSH